MRTLQFVAQELRFTQDQGKLYALNYCLGSRTLLQSRLC